LISVELKLKTENDNNINGENYDEKTNE
jgi:hypothetical protein